MLLTKFSNKCVIKNRHDDVNTNTEFHCPAANVHKLHVLLVSELKMRKFENFEKHLGYLRSTMFDQSLRNALLCRNEKHRTVSTVRSVSIFFSTA